MVNYDTADTASIETRLNELKVKTEFTNAERGEVLDAVTALQARVNTNPATTLENTSESLDIVKQKILDAEEDIFRALHLDYIPPTERASKAYELQTEK